MFVLQITKTQFYKFYKGFHDYREHRFIPALEWGRRASHRVHKAHHLVLPVNRTGTDSFTQCFEYSAIALWNNLSFDATEVTLPVFKRLLAAASFA